MKLLKNLTICALFAMIISGCKSDEPGTQLDSTINSILSQNEWLIFDEMEKGGYTSYKFDGNGNGNLEMVTKDGTIYKQQDFTYSCTKENLIINQTTYPIINITQDYIISEYLGQRVSFYRYAGVSAEIQKLEGTWEELSYNTYNMYELHKDGTYKYEQMIGLAIDQEESGEGTFELGRATITFKPDNKNLPSYSFLYHIDENGDFVYGYNYKNEPYKYIKLTNPSESLRPTPVSQSHPELIDGDWYRYDSFYISSNPYVYKYGAEILHFEENGRLSWKTYYRDFTTATSFDGLFWINDNVLSFSNSYLTSYTIESLTDTELRLQKYSNVTVYHKYKAGELERMLIGTWRCQDVVLTFESNGNFDFKGCDGEIVETQSSGSYTFENSIVKWDMTNPEVWNYLSGGVIEFIDNNNFKLYPNNSTGHIQFQKI